MTDAPDPATPETRARAYLQGAAGNLQQVMLATLRSGGAPPSDTLVMAQTYASMAVAEGLLGIMGLLAERAGAVSEPVSGLFGPEFEAAVTEVVARIQAQGISYPPRRPSW